jgi:hypothetical protein
MKCGIMKTNNFILYILFRILKDIVGMRTYHSNIMLFLAQSRLTSCHHFSNFVHSLKFLVSDKLQAASAKTNI